MGFAFLKSRRSTRAAFALLAIVGILAIMVSPLKFGAGPRCTVEGPVMEIGSPRDWRVLLLLWMAVVLLSLLSERLESPQVCSDFQARTCTRLC